MPTPNATDFYIDVEGVGNFRIARRTMRSELQIGAEYSRLTEGVETPTEWLANVAAWLATLKVVVVEGPAGFGMDEIDPMDPAIYNKLFLIYEAVSEKENSFRGITKPQRQAQGQAPGADHELLVQEKVQPGAQ